MRYLQLLTAILASLTFNLSAAEVYKRIDAKGNVYYSDQPSEGGEQIEVPPITTVPAIKIPATKAPESKRDTANKKYEVSITSPANDMAYHSPEGKISIAVEVSPNLQGDTQLVIKLDGKEISRGQAMQVQLRDINRGTHQISAEVIDNSGNIIAADNSSFTLHKPIIKKKAP